MKHSWFRQGTEELASALEEAFATAKSQGRPAFVTTTMIAVGDEIQHRFEVLKEGPVSAECLIVHPDDVVEIYGGWRVYTNDR